MPAVYSAAAAVLIVAVLAVAYGTAAPQLGVAEFAPAARQAVEPPPTTAAGDSSPGRAAAARRSTTTTQPAAAATTSTGASGASTPTTRVARGRQCVGNPPRQADDPQSPPCIATIFEGDNGGATSTGVSATDIRIAVPMPSDDQSMKAVAAAFFEYFNQHYEFYGRRLVPDFVVGGAADPVQSRQLATDVASRHVLAALTSQINYGSPPPAYLNETARQHILTVTLDRTGLLADSTVYDALHPYVWSVYPSVEQRYRAVGDLICRSLAGKPALHAGPGSKGTTRRFAVVATADFVLPSTSALEQALSCADLVDTVKLIGNGLPGTAVRTAMESLKTQGVTSVVCACGNAWFPGRFMSDAAAAGFFPEWLPLYLFAAEEFLGAQVTPGATYDQISNFLMVTPTSKATPMQTRASFNALLAVDPQLISRLGVTATFYGDLLYRELAVLAAGIQGAGPTLTPDSFAQALMSMAFPNPGAGQAPYWQQSVGFGPGDHSFYDDFALGWWNRSAEVLDPNAPAGKGSWCYVNQGARYQPGTFPADADAKFFDTSQPCR